MVRVPYDVKPLFQNAKVRKNFRVVFPDGERADITNDNVLQESVALSESVCSETVFRFGCCERSMIEFETVGVENITGCRIRCGLEVDLSSFNDYALQLLAYEVNEEIPRGYDGLVVLTADSDLGYPYYRLPYGEFWVESAPRDKANRQNRKVTAYTVDPTVISAPERVRLSTYRPAPVGAFAAKPMALALANLCGIGSDAADRWGLVNTLDGYLWEDIQSAGSYGFGQFSVTSGGHEYAVTVSGTYAAMDFTEKAGIGTEDPIVAGLASLVMSGWKTDEAWKWYVSVFEAAGVDLPTVSAHTRLPRTYFQPHMGGDILDQYGPYDHAPIYWLPDGGCPIYIRETNRPALKANTFVRLMWNLSCSFSVDGIVQATRTFFPLADLDAKIRTYTFSGSLPGTTSTFDYEPTDKLNIGGVDQYSFSDCYKVLDQIRTCLELGARMIRVDRSGVAGMIRLSNVSPQQIPASSVESVFWDDCDISDVGQVRFTAMTLLEGTVSGTVFRTNGGTSIYNLLENFILQNTTYYDSDTAAAVISSDFVPALDAARFIPCEAVFHGWPWLQAGDAVELATGDPDDPTLVTFVLTQKIRGVQTITTEMSASGGSVYVEGNAVNKQVTMIYGGSESSASSGSSGGGGGGGGIPTSTDSASGKGLTAVFRRWGRVAVIQINSGSLNAAVSAGGTVLTAPEGFRPPAAVNILNFSDNKRWVLQSSGALQPINAQSSGQAVRLYAVYLL